MLYNFVDGNPMYIKMSVVSMIKDSEHSNLAILRKVITEAEHIKDFPDLAKHKELLEQLTKYTAQVVEEMTHNPHYFDALYAKYSKASNLVEDKSSILTK